MSKNSSRKAFVDRSKAIPYFGEKNVMYIMLYVPWPAICVHHQMTPLDENGWSDPGRRCLIQQQDLRTSQQSSSNGTALLLTAAELFLDVFFGGYGCWICETISCIARAYYIYITKFNFTHRNIFSYTYILYHHIMISSGIYIYTRMYI